MTEAERRIVYSRAQYCCEYCLSQALLSHDDFAVEHIQPRALDGTDDLSNLALSCQGCNNRKFTAIEAEDPVTGVIAPLYNPREQQWADHFSWSADYGQMEGITPTGRATVARLDLNRSPLVNLRRVLYAAGHHPPRVLGDMAP